MMLASLSTTIILMIICFIMTLILSTVLSKKNKNQLHKIFLAIFSLFIIWILGLLFQITLSSRFEINPIYFDYFIYIPICFMPVLFFMLSLTFANTKFKIKSPALLLFVIPIISLLLLWTNDSHHLFYKVYSTDMSETLFGMYFYVHSIYTYILYLLSLTILISYSIKNSGFFSRQVILVFIGSLFPIITNALGVLGIIPMTIYLTPITFAIAVFFYSLAIFKFNFLSATPIALQRIVDRMSDSYIVINEDNNIIDFNQTFLKMFSIQDKDLRNKNLFEIVNILSKGDSFSQRLSETIIQAKQKNITIKLEKHFSSYNKYFNIEVTSIFSKKTFLGTLILLKDITQHTIDMQTIKSNQETLIEQERLATLGQMIGGIAHNLKTPIMSISGAAEGLSDLTKEYDASIGDEEVTEEDHHQIAHEMDEWIDKIKTHLSYMSDVITAVKGQAVTFSDNSKNSFTAKDLVKHVDILMRHELKHSIVNLNTFVKVDDSIEFTGNINSLVQVVNNIISNAIQAYNGKPNENIDLHLYQENNKLVIKIQDYAGGLPDKVKDKLFKEMITTKGKNGTGLGLFMSYSNIKAHFNGNMRYETTKGEGTSFYIEIPE